jgi:hypothetical protein
MKKVAEKRNRLRNRKQKNPICWIGSLLENIVCELHHAGLS